MKCVLGGAFYHVNCSGCAFCWSKYHAKTAVLCVQLQENGGMSSSAMKNDVQSKLGVEVPAHKLYHALHVIKNEKEASYFATFNLFNVYLHKLKSLNN